jgi:hypothetical protein
VEMRRIVFGQIEAALLRLEADGRKDGHGGTG